MVLEHALLPVAADRRDEFEAAFAQALPLISATPGFRRLRLARPVEHSGSYPLLVEWDRLEDHTEGFRGSDRYAEWSRLLHRFYDPFPEVGHATPTLSAEAPWSDGAPGVVRLPSGRSVRGRGLRRPLPRGPSPTFAVHLVGRRPPDVPWESRWVRWPDFRLPADPAALRAALVEVRERAATERVELACGGGAGEAVAWVRERYDRRAVETRAQARFVAAFR